MSDPFAPTQSSLFSSRGNPFAPSGRAPKSLEQRITDQEQTARALRSRVKDDKGGFMSVLDALEILRYPITNVIYNTTRELVNQDLGVEDVAKIVRSGLMGVLLKEKRNTRDVIDLVAPDAPKIVKFLGGLAGDILTDPLTYATWGAAGAAGAAAKTATQLDTAADLWKIAGKSGRAFTGQMIKRYGGPTIKDAIQNAARQMGEEVGEVGLRVFGKQIIKGSPVTAAARFAERQGARGIAQTIRNLPQAATKIPIVGKAIQTGKEAFSTAEKFGGGIAGRAAREIELSHLAKESRVLEQFRGEWRAAVDDIVALGDDILELMPDAGKTTISKVGATLEHIRKLAETGDLDKAAPRIGDIAKRIRQNITDPIHENLVRRGFLKPKQYIPDYFPRYFVKDGEDPVRLLYKFEHGTKASFLETRVFQSAEEARKLGWEPLGVLESFDAYINKALRIMTIHDQAADLTARFGRTFGGHSGRTATRIRKRGGIVLEPITAPGLKDLPAFKGKALPEEIARIINDKVEYFTKPKVLDKVGQVFRNLNNFWKRTVTVVRPGFHSRNLASNIWTGVYKDGIANAGKNYQLAHKLWLTAETADVPKGAIKIGREVNTQLGWYNHARELGVHTGTFARAQVAESLLRSENLPELIKNPVRRIGRKWVLSGEAVGNYVENVSRMASWLADIRKGITPEAAARRVKQFFLDYSDLTQFEDSVKQIIPFYCVPDDTEILTRSGWKLRCDLSVGEEVLTYDTKIDATEWQPVQDVAVFDFDDELVRARGKLADFRFTADHRFPVQISKSFVKRRRYGGNRKIVRANKLNTSHSLILSAPYKAPGESVLSPRDAAIVGWIVTDGYQRKRGNHLEQMIYQHPSKHADEIRELLDDLCTSERRHPESGVICFRISAKWPVRVEKTDLPAIVSHLSLEACQAMYDAMMKAEGCSANRATQWVQVEGPVLDAFQILSQLLNKPFNWSKRCGSKARSGYVRKTRHLRVNCLEFTKERYVGKIWCPKTANSTWVMRQNGRVVITGNTWLKKNLVQQSRMLLEAPGKYAMYTVKPIRNMDFGDQFFEELSAQHLPKDKRQILPDWMLENKYLFPFGLEVGGKPVGLSPNLPFQDLGRMNIRQPLRSLAGAALEGITPLAKTPLEIGVNRKFLTGQPVEYPAQRSQAPAWFDVLKLLPEEWVARMGFFRNPETGAMDGPPKLIYALQQLAPMLSSSGTPSMIARTITGQLPEYQAERTPYKVLGATGVQMRPIDLRYYQEQYLKNRLEELRLANAAARKYGGE